jgi:hypothetical protein
LTAGGTRLLTEHTQLNAKGVKTKDKSSFGLVFQKDGFLKSDLDIAFVKDLRTGKMLSNTQVLKDIVNPLNMMFAKARPGRANNFAFKHGAHLNAMEAPGMDAKTYGKIGPPGPVTVFGRGQIEMMSGMRVRSYAKENRMPWHSDWDVSSPKGMADWMNRAATIAQGQYGTTLSARDKEAKEK